MKKIIATLLTLALPALGFAAGGGNNEHLVHAPINPDDKVSLQKGAQIFVNYCLGCHSAKYQRYQRMAQDLEIPEELVKENMIFHEDGKIGDKMLRAMPEELGEQWFGTAPPDLTLEARLRGVDWLYSYLIGFYPDESRPFGYNNHIFADVGMPHVLADMEDELGEEQFHEAMADLTNFMFYIAEPIRAERERLGKIVLFYLLILGIFAYFLNREYWKDVH